MREWRLENKGWRSRFKGMEIEKQVDGVQGSRGPGDCKIRWGSKGKPEFRFKPCICGPWDLYH